MSLTKLPNELLLAIFQALGREYFRQDIRRLTVSKKWYEVAEPFFFQVLRMHLTTVSYFAYFATINPNFLKPIDQHTKTIEIYLERSKAPLKSPDSFDTATVILTKFSRVLHKAKLSKLSALKILRCLNYPDVFDNALHGRIFSRLLSFDHLSQLEIDLSPRHMEIPHRPKGGKFGPVKPDVNKHHLCNTIGALLPKLQSLRCRLGFICEDILTVPAGVKLPFLRELIINLSRREPWGYGHFNDHSYMCLVSNDTAPYPRIRERLISRTQHIVTLASSLRMARIIVHRERGHRWYAYDAINDNWARLEPNGAWDAKGKPVRVEIAMGPPDEPHVTAQDQAGTEAGLH